MRFLEVRRHSLRKHGGGSQLSQEGVTFARELGGRLGPFAHVAASVVPRSRETAIAMGFAVDEEIVPLLTGEDVHAEIEASQWGTAARPMSALAELLEGRGAAWRYASALLAHWRDIVIALPDGAAALVISHSGEIELPLVACFPEADHATWGQMFAPCEGVRLTFDGDPPRFTQLTLLREGAAGGLQVSVT
ncbi:MAG TPA: hypothetical protein VHW60_02040 [Caulobacteraceae bacterium]|jgi:broad specificity phosphatase PhoE|nr:hypothetical protein [Caulobacteraceae bacterium]